MEPYCIGVITTPFDFRSYISLLEDKQRSDDDDADDICLEMALQESARYSCACQHINFNEHFNR